MGWGEKVGGGCFEKLGRKWGWRKWGVEKVGDEETGG